MQFECVKIRHSAVCSDGNSDGQMTVDTALVMLQNESSKAEDLAEVKRCFRRGLNTGSAVTSCNV